MLLDIDFWLPREWGSVTASHVLSCTVSLVRETSLLEQGLAQSGLEELKRTSSLAFGGTQEPDNVEGRS